MTRQPVAEGERVQYGDVFAYTAIKSGAVVEVAMFIRHRTSRETYPDCWVGLRMGDDPGLVWDFVPLIERNASYRWERVL